MADSIVSVLTASVVAAAFVAAGVDVFKFRIPNWIVLTVALLAAVKSFAMGPDVLLWSSLHSFVALLVGVALFAMGWVGGGDAKFYAALALAVPFEQALAMLFWSSIGGFLLLVVMAIARRVAGDPLVPSDSSRWSVPYGVAIFVGGSAALMQQPL